MRLRLFSLALLSTATLLSPARAELPAEVSQKRDRTVQQAVTFLEATQAADGSWTSPQALGITALVVNSLVENGNTLEDEAVAKGVAFLLKHKQEDGGIYVAGSTHRNYETCITVMVLTKLNNDGQYDPLLKDAEKFLRGLQWDEGEGLESSDTAYGGAGYGGHSRPDLSNTQFLMETLKELGAGEDDPAIQKALLFVSRTQNLESEYNTTEFAAKVDDGGFYYTPAAGGTSQAGTTDNGGLRSYASMTYAGLKSMIYAGLTKDDRRVKAAYEWLQQNYSLKENPGLGQQGLYYYFHTFSKTMSVLGEETFTDADGTEHDWRSELVDRLAALQKPNGSWTNSAERWYEGDPNLATAYALTALGYVDDLESESETE